MSAVSDLLRARLTTATASAGGCGYYRGQAPRVEPTAWMSLALQQSAPSKAILGWQRADGHVIDPVSPEPNFGWDGLALLALLPEQPVASPPIAALVDAIVASKGVRLEESSAIRQDTAIQAWSWIDGTFSWVEPTAWCLLSVKKSGRRTADVKTRIEDGERMLLDRVCQNGGWNYGNSNAFSQDLRPYVPTTALSLLALADRRERAEVTRSLAWLEANATTERSAMALSLSAVALHVYGRPIAGVIAALEEQHARTAFLENVHLSAMALYALTIPIHDAAAFRLGGAPARGNGR